MPLWLLRVLPYGAAALAILAAVWFIDHRGYERAESYYKLQQADADLRQAAENKRIADARAAMEQTLRNVIAESDLKLQTRIDTLHVTERTVVQPTLVKEIQSAPRFTDPSLGITDGMLRVLNTARSFSWPDGSCVTNADGSATCSLPAARSSDGQDNRTAGHSG